jgi:hypothetical protein
MPEWQMTSSEGQIDNAVTKTINAYNAALIKILEMFIL